MYLPLSNGADVMKTVETTGVTYVALTDIPNALHCIVLTCFFIFLIGQLNVAPNHTNGSIL